MKVMNVLGWVLGVLFLMVLFTCSGQVWLFQVPWYLVVGWVSFLLKVVPEVTWRWGAIAETVAVVAVLGVGSHLFLRRLWRQLRPEDAREWPVRWSVSLVALLVLLFSATMATVGIGHHVGWLASGRAPLTVSSWHFLATHMEWDNEGLCQTALTLSKSGVPDARIGQALLAGDEVTRTKAERLHVVPWRAAGGEAGFLVFPRDPLSRERAGGVHCGGGVKMESFRAAELPKLLSGPRVAADTAP
ncbi:hypothetical protein ATI61_12445 [Archangium gephyra]|uniref:Uncharacterized protein n=1 Tax=Archangium gephyra TaxID=48 RepID=A0AAC8TB72_9BACT|nr:hypothetical protein [Archangium gephyra]AKI99322.1 Hypothetical protein AA314_00949 [Archangium gephyra]REG15460.1 hypothetical protein ATI61_12445 [Archangium gephyra]